MLTRLLLLAVLTGILSGCAFPGSNAGPTAYPTDYLPTVIYLTAESLNGTMSAQTAAALTPEAALTETPSPMPATPTLTPPPTAEPGVPLAALQVTSPGSGSKVASPLEVRVNAVSGESEKVQIDLFGEDGRLLYSRIFLVPSQASGVYVFQKIPFQIRAAAEVGILQISTRDRAGRIQSLNTVRLILLSSGSSQINPAGINIYERVVLYDLPPKSNVSGGVLTLQGRYLPFNRQPLILELVGLDGKVLGLRVLTFSNLDTAGILTTIPYKAGAATEARLVIHQSDDVLTGPVYIYSQELTLNP